MNASICSRYHEQFFIICTIFEISIDTDYPPFHTARWILLLKRRSRKKTLKSIIVPSKFNSILHTSTFLIYIYIFQTIATSIQKYNLSNNQKKKIIFTRAIIFSQLSIYLSICSKTKLFEFFERMQRLSARSSTSNIRSKRRPISSKDEKAGRTRTMSLEGNRRAFPIPPRRLQDSDLTVVTCSISAIVCRS